MAGRRDSERDRGNSRLARQYLKARANQWQERQPSERQSPESAIRLPRLDTVQLGSPEIEAQLRLLALARVRSATTGAGWFLLAVGSARRGDARHS